MIIYAVLCLLSLQQALCFDYPQLVQRMASIAKPWVSGHNHYFDHMPLEQIMQLMGTLPENPAQKLPERSI